MNIPSKMSKRCKIFPRNHFLKNKKNYIIIQILHASGIDIT